LKKLSEVIIVGPAYPLRGGIANFNEALCRTLIKEGKSCQVVSFSLQYPGFLFPGTTQMATGDAAPEGIPINTIINSINPVSWIRAARYIRKQNPIGSYYPVLAAFYGSVLRNYCTAGKKKQARH
jgi:hypothetical protein